MRSNPVSAGLFGLSLGLFVLIGLSCSLPVETTNPSNHPPQLTLLGHNPDTTVAGVAYAEAGAVATDAEDGAISINDIYVAYGSFNDTIPSVGTYTARYYVRDSKGLIDSAHRTIVVIAANSTNHAPQITLMGDLVDTIPPAIAYTDPGATATDVEDGNLSDSIYVVYGTFNYASPVIGTYKLYYIVMDQGGLVDTTARTVVVKAGAMATSDTIRITDPVSGSIVYKDTTKVYLLPASSLTITVGASITFAKRVLVINKGKIYVHGNLSIDSGSVFLMGKDGCIETYDGQLNIRGSDSLPVYFKNLTPGQFWGADPNSTPSPWAAFGISIATGANANSTIQHCVVDSATTAINIGKDSLLLSNITARFNKYTGIYFNASGPRDSTTFIDINLIGNGATADFYPLVISANFLAQLSDSISFNTNSNNAVEVVPEIVTASGTWKALNVPYVVRYNSYINISNPNGVIITVAPGAQFKFTAGTYGSYIQMGNGTLKANGTPLNHIKFEGLTNGTYWGRD